MINQLICAKITKKIDKTYKNWGILQNLTNKVLVFPEKYTNFVPEESFQRKI